MTNEQHGIIETEKPKAQPINLLRVPYANDSLLVSYPAFGPNTYTTNLTKMQKTYSHNSKNLHFGEFSFSEPTTAESISAAAHDFENLAKPKIFDNNWLQAGRIVRTSEGVFVNPPKDEQGNPLCDEAKLKKLLDGAQKVNGIYIVKNPALRDFGFAPYKTFKQGVQKAGDFIEGGLARVLEHSTGKAEKLGVVASPQFYRRGVDVLEFGPAEEPILRVAGFYSGRYFGSGRLDVDGYWGGGYCGCAFGVFRGAGEASAQKILA